jgi:hypothetical protein
MSDDDLFLPARAVRKRYSKSDMAIHRWLQDAKLGFPKPSYICGYRHYSYRVPMRRY